MRRRGYSVASVKDIHNDVFAIDRVGSNTYRHGKAGAQIVVARGLKETDVLIPSRLSAESILAYLEDFDFVVTALCKNGSCNLSTINERST